MTTANASDTEIGNRALPRLSQDVGRLEVTMHDAALVRQLQRIRDEAVRA